ncbi:MAG TPA: hypothetical protein VHC90_02865 [Bryobacteraceae bacterium]|nr:hypothetical protein [Bryobacteraceae bacterium]
MRPLLRFLALAIPSLFAVHHLSAQESASTLAHPRVLAADSPSSLPPAARYRLAGIPAFRLNPLSAEERRPHENRGLTSVGLERKTGALTGRWETVSPNQQLWRLRIVSPGAESVQLHLRNVNRAAGKLFVSGAELTAPDRTLWSPAIPGDELTLEYEPLPGDNTHHLPFEIAGLVHIYGPLTAAASPSCYVDVACSPNPRADSVGLITFTNPDDQATYACTGTLVNIASASAQFEAVPLFLTAGHCIASQDEASSAPVTFHYQAATCGGSTSAPESFAMPPATLLANTSMGAGDHALLQLSRFPTDSLTEPVLAGWSTGDLPQTGLFSLHHVGGLLMKESQGYRLPDADATVEGTLAPADQYYQVGFSYGASGQGASGAGIFDSSGTLFGTLSYGAPGACQMAAGFGRLSSGFDSLAPWLSGTQGGVGVAGLTSPAAGSALDSLTPLFVWNDVPAASGYTLNVGTQGPGSGDAWSTAEGAAGSGNSTSQQAQLLPATVTNLWVRLTTNFSFGSWYNDYVYRPPPSESYIYQPPPGSTLNGQISWTPMRALSYTLTIGDTGPGSADLFSQVIPNYKGASLSVSPSLPADGRKLYVRLAWTTPAGSGYKDYNYTAVFAQTAVRMIRPQVGGVLPAGDVTFQWSSVPGALSYDLSASSNNWSAKVDGLTGTSATIPGIPGNGQQVWVTVVWHMPMLAQGGLQEFVYTASPVGNLPPSITSAYPKLSAGAWVSVYGNNLSQTTRSWTAADFVDGKLPTSLDGVSVQVNGQNAYVSYISPAQINFLAPASCCQNGSAITVTSPLGTGTRSLNDADIFAPGLFTLPQLGGMYAVATFPDGGIEGPAGLLGDSAPTRPAAAGDVITLWASGLGQTNPAYPEGQLITQPLPLANNVTVQIGGATAQVDYVGLIEAGLYQINVHVPNVPSGDEPVSISVGQLKSPAPLYISVQ